MTHSHACAIVVAVLLGAGAAATARPAHAQTRDFSAQAKFEPSGTGVISGTIVSDDDPPRAMRRIVVRLTEAASIIQPRVVTSDESGRFAFRNLPPGRYSVTGERQPYLTGAYGARRIAGPGSVQTGTVIVLANGQQVGDVAVKMLRGAVITGTVRDVTGEPARNLRVTASYYQRAAVPGGRRLVTQTSATTDDRGDYRLYGLPPGSYVISATGALGAAAQITAAEIARATEQIERPGVASGLATGPSAATVLPPRRPEVGYAPVYYPGTADLGQATTVDVGVAELRSAVDFHLMLMSMASLEGTLVGADGSPRSMHAIRAVQLSATGGPSGGAVGQYQTTTEGRFVITGLAPGRYLLEARPVQEKDFGYFASLEVLVAGDSRNVALTMQPSMTLAGRVVFESTTRKPPSDLSKVSVSMSPIGPAVTASNTANVSATGEFKLPGLIPGRYQLSASLPLPPLESGWYLKSATINGQETLDVPAEVLAGSAVLEAVITMTDQPSELSGTMTDATGSPAPEYFIIAFAEEESHWQFGSRRIMQTRPSSDGSFSFRNLPPGTYRLAAVTDVQLNDWFDPDFLKQLVPASVRLVITDRGKTRQDLRIGR